MFIVIAFIFMGMLLGYTIRKKSTEWLSRLLTLLVWVLLFLMGIEVGGNDRIMRALPTLGVEALLLSVLATLGSCGATWLLWKYINRNGGAWK